MDDCPENIDCINKTKMISTVIPMILVLDVFQ